MPYRSSSKNATIAANKIIHTFKYPTTAAPFSNVGDDQIVALRELVDIFGNITKITAIPEETPKTVKTQSEYIPPTPVTQ